MWRLSLSVAACPRPRNWKPYRTRSRRRLTAMCARSATASMKTWTGGTSISFHHIESVAVPLLLRTTEPLGSVRSTPVTISVSPIGSRSGAAARGEYRASRGAIRAGRSAQDGARGRAAAHTVAPSTTSLPMPKTLAVGAEFQSRAPAAPDSPLVRSGLEGVDALKSDI
jgi:hypothetical protein